MRNWMNGLIVALLGFAVSATWAAELGGPAGTLKIKEWVKGKPVEIKAGGPTKAYVVEFWATWCGPCRQSIPHLTEMSKKYKDKGVVFVGISDEDSAKVKPFVEKMGAKMDYVVAVDDAKATSKAYMEAFEQGGIPTAFVVDQKGKVVWFGHPLIGLEEVVDKVVAGTSDPKALKEVSAKMEQSLNETMQAIQDYLQKAANGDKATFPENLLTSGAKSPILAGAFNQLSWAILTDGTMKTRDLPFALRLAKAAADATHEDDPAILDTYAKALWDNGKKDEAVKTQQRAVSLATDERMKAELQQRLNEYSGKEQK